MAKKKISYNEAVQEIQDILQKIENEELDVDELTSNVKRVSYLIKLCKQKLRNTEEEVEKIINQMEEEPTDKDREDEKEENDI